MNRIPLRTASKRDRRETREVNDLGGNHQGVGRWHGARRKHQHLQSTLEPKVH
jgi:hypothetical protein